METRIKTALDGFRKSVLDAHGMDFLINLAYRFLGMVGANGKNLSAVFNPDYR